MKSGVAYGSRVFGMRIVAQYTRSKLDFEAAK